MITGELRNKIDKIWETFWTGGDYKSTGCYRAIYLFVIYQTVG